LVHRRFIAKGNEMRKFLFVLVLLLSIGFLYAADGDESISPVDYEILSPEETSSVEAFSSDDEAIIPDDSLAEEEVVEDEVPSEEESSSTQDEFPLDAGPSESSSVDESGVKVRDERKSFDPEKYDYTFGLIPIEDLDIAFSTHLYVESFMAHGYPTIGGTWDMGVRVDTITISPYIRFHHFFRPLGSKTGLLYIGEEFTELGVSFKTRLYEHGRFSISLGFSSGWYQQWVMHRSSDNTYNMVNNGFMIRPEVSIGWNWIGWWIMELGFFYQIPLYPSYDDYQAWGVFLKIL